MTRGPANPQAETKSRLLNVRIDVADDKAPAFGFTGSWPFNGKVTCGGHPVGTVTGWTVTAPADGLPQVTLTLLAPTALALALTQADVTVDDRTRDALLALGWTAPDK